MDDYLQFWREVGTTISNSKVTAVFAEQLTGLHDYTGLPWWSVIVMSSFVLRFSLMFPAQMFSQKVAANRVIAYKELDQELIPALKNKISLMSRQKRWDLEYTKDVFNHNAQKLTRETVVKYNCGRSRIYLPNYVQIPIWMAMTAALQRLSHPYYDVNRSRELAQEGALWFQDLTASDPQVLLPVIMGSVFLINMELWAHRYPREAYAKKETLVQIFKWFSRGMIVFLVGISCQMNSAVCLYWTTSAFAGLAANIVIISPRARKVFNVPFLKNIDSERPYLTIYDNVSESIRRFYRKKS